MTHNRLGFRKFLAGGNSLTTLFRPGERGYSVAPLVFDGHRNFLCSGFRTGFDYLTLSRARHETKRTLAVWTCIRRHFLYRRGRVGAAGPRLQSRASDGERDRGSGLSSQSALHCHAGLRRRLLTDFCIRDPGSFLASRAPQACSVSNGLFGAIRPGSGYLRLTPILSIMSSACPKSLVTKHPLALRTCLAKRPEC